MTIAYVVAAMVAVLGAVVYFVKRSRKDDPTPWEAFLAEWGRIDDGDYVLFRSGILVADIELTEDGWLWEVPHGISPYTGLTNTLVEAQEAVFALLSPSDWK